MLNEKKTVIIVDDDEDLLNLLIAAFQAQGFATHGVGTGKEALAYLLDAKNLETACLLVLDRMLPDMDGLDILKQFRAASSRQLPVLILSMLSSEKDVLCGLKAGAIDYMGKPFSLPILMQKASALIGRA